MVPVAEKYSIFAPFYDLMSGEYPVYRAGRKQGIGMLALTPGLQVLDIGCGTGLNFALLQERIGPAGRIVGIDRSPEMLAKACRRAKRRNWHNVILLQADATTLSPAHIGARIVEHGGRERSDAALATYALSLMPDWEAAWTKMAQLSRPGAALGVVDMQEPVGRYQFLAPLARLACALGGADINAHPWTGVEHDCEEVSAACVRGGHIQIRTGRSRLR